MRKPLVAGNWKMHNSVAEARSFVAELVPSIRAIQGVDKVLCPPFTDLLAVKALLEGTDIALGAQNMHWEAKGAYTGEISPGMIAELCQYVILGHSERRAYFYESDDKVNLKVKSAINHSLIPIVCVGETLEENETNRTEQVVTHQVKMGLNDVQVSLGRQIVVAYEPVWAIGTGKAATAQGANQVIGLIRNLLAAQFGNQISQEIRILYGGSVKASNAAEFFSQPEIDGGLVGGACLISDEFTRIIQAAY